MAKDVSDDQPDDSLAGVHAVYRALEQRPLERACELRTDCCRFRLTGLTPQVTLGEAYVAWAALRAGGRARASVREDGACPFLGRDDRCTVYEARPFACRTHFCRSAGGRYPRRHVVDLIHRLEVIDARLGGDGPQSLIAAVEALLAGKRRLPSA